MEQEKRIYRLKHKPTGFYYMTWCGYSMLSDKGTIYTNDDTQIMRILENCRINGTNKYISGNRKLVQEHLDIFSKVGNLQEINGVYYWGMESSPDDFEKEYLS